MCLAIPALIKKIDGAKAVADIEGITRDISSSSRRTLKSAITFCCIPATLSVLLTRRRQRRL